MEEFAIFARKNSQKRSMPLNPATSKPPLFSLFLILVLVLFGFVIVGPGIGLIAASFVYDGNLLDALSNPSQHPDVKNALILMQGIGAVIGLILMPWGYLVLIDKKNPTRLFRGESNWLMIIATTALAVVTMSIAISPIVDWNAHLQFPDWLGGFGRWARESEDLAADLIKLFTSDLNPVSFAFLFLVVAIVPAIGEELVFRGMIQTELYRAARSPHLAIWVAAIIFSAIHFQFFGFVPRVLIGAFLGYLYYWSGNLWVPIIGHFFNNGIQLVGLYLYQKGIITFNPESTDTMPVTFVAITIVITLALLMLLKNYFASRSKTTGGTAQEL
jgi:membrane protease YdiL (CAAX protease family)